MYDLSLQWYGPSISSKKEKARNWIRIHNPRAFALSRVHSSVILRLVKIVKIYNIL